MAPSCKKSSNKNTGKAAAAVIGKKRVVLLVHADWCPHCVALMQPRGGKGDQPSIWDTVKRDLPDVTFLDVEYAEYQQIMHQAPGSPAGELLKKTVSGFPCIFIVDKLRLERQVNPVTQRMETAKAMDVRHFEGAKRDVRTIKSFVQKHYFSEAL